jgi:hypothetical protein
VLATSERLDDRDLLVVLDCGDELLSDALHDVALRVARDPQ